MEHLSFWYVWWVLGAYLLSNPARIQHFWKKYHLHPSKIFYERQHAYKSALLSKLPTKKKVWSRIDDARQLSRSTPLLTRDHTTISKLHLPIVVLARVNHPIDHWLATAMSERNWKIDAFEMSKGATLIRNMIEPIVVFNSQSIATIWCWICRTLRFASAI